MSLNQEFDPRESPTRTTHENDPQLNPRVRSKSLTHELDPYENDLPNIVSSPPLPSPPQQKLGGSEFLKKLLLGGGEIGVIIFTLRWGDYILGEAFS